MTNCHSGEIPLGASENKLSCCNGKLFMSTAKRKKKTSPQTAQIMLDHSTSPIITRCIFNLPEMIFRWRGKKRRRVRATFVIITRNGFEFKTFLLPKKLTSLAVLRVVRRDSVGWNLYILLIQWGTFIMMFMLHSQIELDELSNDIQPPQKGLQRQNKHRKFRQQ